MAGIQQDATELEWLGRARQTFAFAVHAGGWRRFR